MKLNKLFLIMFLVVLLVAPMVSASLLDNKISFDKVEDFRLDKKVIPYNNLWEKYSPIEIKSWLGLGKTLFKGALTEHTEVCGNDNNCFSTMEIYLPNDGTLVDDVKFYTEQEDKSWNEQDIRWYNFKYWGLIDDYETKCHDGKTIISENGTYTPQICEQIKVGSHEGWINYHEGQEVPAGEYTLKLTGEKKPSRTVDWVIETKGEVLDSLAVWGNISTGDDAEVILNLPTNNYITYTFLNTFNATANVTNGATLTNMSLWTNESGSWEGYNLTNISKVGYKDETVYSQSGFYNANSKNVTVNNFVSFASADFKLITTTRPQVKLRLFFYYSDGSYFETAYSSTPYHDRDWNTISINNPYPLRNVSVITFNYGCSSTGSEDTTFNATNFTIIEFTTLSTQTWDRTITDEIVWNVQACDSDGDCGFAPANYSLFLDVIPPTINIDSPDGYYDYLSENYSLQLNFTATDAHNLDSCWFEYNGTNNTISCLSGVLNSSNFNYTKDINSLIVWANDTIGNTNSSFISWNYRIFTNSESYNETTYETASEYFIINTTANSSLTSANLNFGGVAHASTKTGTVFTSETFDIPASEGNKTFYWDFTYAGTHINSTLHNQTVYPTWLGLCNATLTQPYINFTFKDEELLTALNASIDSSTWIYWLGDGTVTKSFLFSNVSENLYYPFCLNDGNRTMHNTRSIQYSSTGYPQRKYDASSDLTNTTTNKLLYLLSDADGIYSMIQVVDEEGNRISDVEITIERQFAGVWTIVGQETTDSAGTVTFWVNPDYDHRLTFVSDDCTGTTVTIRPTQTQYTQQLQCGGVISFTSQIEGLRFYRGPADGIIQTGIHNFTYKILSSKDNIINASFRIVNSSNNYVFNFTDSACTPSGCTLSFLYEVLSGDNIKGWYYVDVGNGSFLLEADAHWVNIDIPTVGKTGISTFFRDLLYVFEEWGSSEEGAEPNASDFNRIVVLFFFMCLAISYLNIQFKIDTNNPGAFLLMVTIFVWLGSLIGGTTSTGLFYFNDLTGSIFIDNYTLAFLCSIISGAYFLNVNRRVQQ